MKETAHETAAEFNFIGQRSWKRSWSFSTIVATVLST